MPANADTSLCYYAKITSDGTYFYSSCNEEDKLFKIPPTYFVLLTDNASDDFYCAKYGNCLGYVKKNQVIAMDGTPSNPYASSYSFRITSMSGLPLMDSPSFESNKLITIDFLEENVFFYGEKSGQEYFSNSTDIWYYCSYTKGDTTYFGYLFSYYCNFQTNIKDNNEYFEEITSTLKFKPEMSVPVSTSDTITAIIVLAIAIPLLILCYFFLAPRSKHKKAKLVKRKKDYYELSENDLN